jgi:glutathione S-transferase
VSGPADVQLHLLTLSHPCLTARAALDHKGVAYEEVVMPMGEHREEMAQLYGEGRSTVPGMTVDGERVHGSTAILARLEELVPGNPLYPEGIADQVREAELWGDGDYQDLGRRLPWAALHFRPEATGTFAGGDPLDPAGVDFAIATIRASWKYHSITAERTAADIAALPGMVERIEGFAAEGLLGGGEPTAADFQIGATTRILLTIDDLEPVFQGTTIREVALRYFPDYPGTVPAGAYPTGWVRPG